MFKPSRILIPTDMSDHADKAVRQGFEIAKLFGSEVFVLHVVHDHVQQCTVDYCIDSKLADDLQKQVVEGAREGIKKQVEKLVGEEAAKATLDVKVGAPYDQILKEADEKAVDLIVISSLGTTGIGKYLIGSVARHVLLGAKCSVLLTR
ncbi:MAG: universal stress protein [Geobacteraceae bacterium]|nr:universal stress protein [Geobacteraceae bacterium]